MSARLKLKNLKTDLKHMREYCSSVEAAALDEKHRCYNVLKKNSIEIGAVAELYPVETMRGALRCLDSNVQKVVDAIVRKYTEQLAEHVRNQLVTKYALRNFSAFGVRLLAPVLTDEHIKVEIMEAKCKL